MATEYTGNLFLRLIEEGNTDWEGLAWDNYRLTDVLFKALLSKNRVVSGLAATPVASSLQINYTAGEVKFDDTSHTPTASSVTCTANSVNWLFVNSSGTVQLSTSMPTGEYIPIAMIDAGATSIARIADLRPMRSAEAEVFHVRDQRSQGSAGGASIAGTQVRTLQTVVTNQLPGASLASNQPTVPAGTYDIYIIAPTNGAVILTKLRLYSVTGSAYVAEGISTTGGNSGASTHCFLQCVLTLTAPTTFEVRHYTGTAIATSGLGIAVSQGVEVYTEAIFMRRKV
jgi:hypothetical protein